MNKTVFNLLAIALAPACAFAIDGQVLINQSTVMAAGGFPYVISQPGSYKLSGNLTMTTTASGNYAPLGVDAAIVIASSDVILDLNGFTIQVSHNLPTNTHSIYGIVNGGSFALITVRNGTIIINGSGATSVAPSVVVAGVSVAASSNTTIENLNVSTLLKSVTTNALFRFTAIEMGTRSLVRHNVSDSSFMFNCPSLIVENIASGFGNNAPSCVLVNNLF